MSGSSAILKSSLAKKYWMAFTGLFLCLFLIGHLAGNLQLFMSGYEGRLQFNEYAVFMTTNPAVKLLSYLTYLSIIFHAIDGIMLTVANKKARPVAYASNNAGANSAWASRNMAVLGLILLIYIVVHMSDFWYEYKFGALPYMTAQDMTTPLLKSGEAVAGGQVVNGIVMVNGQSAGPVMKDLYTEVMKAFQVPWIVILYVFSMLAMAFHLSHGFQSAFQSLGLRHHKYTPLIKKTGTAFAVIVSLLFAAIPVYIFFMH
ncbi:MAG: succinate dehydrogenase cytochrome b subunit [Flavobacteriales bacterium]|nr:succinate dehydrogenase cytochrome b subunit [Flavobacteriales bacterium]